MNTYNYQAKKINQSLLPQHNVIIIVKIFCNDSGVMSMSVPDLAAEYGVTESTVNTWLKAISQPATESADIPASMLDEIGTIPNQDSVVELAQSFNVTERYVRKRIADRNRANFLDSGDVDLSNEEIAAKYGIRKASVTSWKAEADRMW